jgi:ribosomal protein S18 acetylase RimI-like enzyme
LKQRLKQWLFGLVGKDPEAVVVTFAAADDALAAEVRRLIPDREHFAVTTTTGLRRRFRRKRIGMLAVPLGDPKLLRAAFLLAPTRILAFNRRGERHHLRLACWIASWLFLRGVPLDRIWLRPRWLWPWKRDRSVYSREHRVLSGRATSAGRRRIGVVSPYFPYPLSHGGAVRIFHLLREMAREFDVFLFAFAEDQSEEDLARVMEFCASAVLLPVPRYREPRWSTIEPPEVCEFRSPAMLELVERFRAAWKLDLIQTEYAYMASYGGDVLVEHDVTFDLYDQVRRRRPGLAAWWDWQRWRRYETAAVRRFRRVVVMSEKDAELIGGQVIPNGVDLERFTPEPEPDSRRLLFVGSFRHFPNLTAYRFLAGQVWPRLRERFPDMTLTVVAGPDGLRYLGRAAPADESVHLLEFVRDVRPLYAEANIVVVPTLESAGTNLKVLEAMAMERAVVSTASGCAGLGLVHGESVWIAGTAEEFAEGVAGLAEDPALRRRLAVAARAAAEERFDWAKIGEAQRELLRELLAQAKACAALRPGTAGDLERIGEIQDRAPEAAHWGPERYLSYDVEVAEVDGRVAAFLVSRQTAPGEREILNLAVEAPHRRRGLATALIESLRRRCPEEIFLEVRESNRAARNLYRKLGFENAGVRPGYYDGPAESAIVMRLRSC